MSRDHSNRCCRMLNSPKRSPSHSSWRFASMVRTLVLHAFFMLIAFLPKQPNVVGVGFTAEIIHRDSPFLHRRDLELTNSFQSPVRSHTADHLMQFSIGTPPVQILAVMDTGSDLVWSRCKPCTDCIDRPAAFFDPALSSTYNDLPCDSPLCKSLDATACTKGPNCSYVYAYGDGSNTQGLLATETLTFDSTDGGTVSFPHIAFGCGHNNSPSFDVQLHGLAGIGGGPLSLISQLGSFIGGKFSYCLVPQQDKSSTSMMKFGDAAVISGDNVVSTPLVHKEDPTYYYVTLQSISVGGTSIEVVQQEGNMIIDCGTTVTLLGSAEFERLSDVVAETVKLPRLKDPGGTFTCFNATSRDGFPDITFHFSGGADLILHPLNTFTLPSPEGLVCLAMQATAGTALFGNQAQQNFVLAYDLVASKVSFSPAQCSSQS